MSNGAWADEENDLIIADYFAMLAEDISARRYSKAEHRRALLPLLNDRSEGFRRVQAPNISAVLKGLGEDWIPGYKPTFNYQMTLMDAVARWLALNPAWLGRQPGLQTAAGPRVAAEIWVGPPPTLSNQPPPQELEQMLHIAQVRRGGGRDERNRALGRAGEERVLAHERAALRTAGRDDLGQGPVHLINHLHRQRGEQDERRGGAPARDPTNGTSVLRHCPCIRASPRLRLRAEPAPYLTPRERWEQWFPEAPTSDEAPPDDRPEGKSPSPPDRAPSQRRVMPT